ncbi:MAG: glycosyltransferase family 9 protein [Deltaproteobacteria bacterium]|nr:glycosyltransferase family 9 protein [Deltaproteobacteria bacterium]
MRFFSFLNTRQNLYPIILTGIQYVAIACFLLFDWISVIGVRRKTHSKRHVLIVRLDLIGDFVLWLPAARALRNLFPSDHWHVTLVANTSWADLAVRQVNFDEVWPVDVLRLGQSPAYRLRIFQRVRAACFDVAIQPTYSREMLRGDAVIRVSAAQKRIGSQGDCSNISCWLKRITDRWYTQLIHADTQPMTELRRNAEFVKGMGCQCDVGLAKLQVDHESLPTILYGAQFFVLFPGASTQGKRWPLERFAQVAQYVSSQYGWQGVICGGSSEQLLGEHLCRMAAVPLLNLVGKTSLMQLVEVLAHARLVLTNDTSAAHIGPAVGSPTVCILGGGHFGRFLPYDSPDASLVLSTVSAHMNCFGCNWCCIYGAKSHTPFPCVKNVSIIKVQKAILDVLPTTGASKNLTGSGYARKRTDPLL